MLVALDWWENGLYEFELELREKYPQLNLRAHIANIQDKRTIFTIFQKTKPDFVFHAAAYKHVPLMEHNPAEAIKNNVIGTWNVARAAKASGTKKFIFIFTDKAVHPTSIMGATKAVGEILIESLNGGRTLFSSVRFGNVLASHGSVIPLFKKQILKGGPITLTHPDMVRYFMSIPEAVQLILQASRLTKGGEIFVLDMGDPVRMLDLARDLIRLSGFRPDIDIPITYTGIRPGEKIIEEILTEQEGVRSTKRVGIFVTTKRLARRYGITKIIKKAHSRKEANTAHGVRNFLQELLPDYRPNPTTTPHA